MRKKKFTKNVGVLLTDEQYKQLVQITDENEMTLSEYVRALIQEQCGQTLNGQGRQPPSGDAPVSGRLS